MNFKNIKKSLGRTGVNVGKAHMRPWISFSVWHKRKTIRTKQTKQFNKLGMSILLSAQCACVKQKQRLAKESILMQELPMSRDDHTHDDKKQFIGHYSKAEN